METYNVFEGEALRFVRNYARSVFVGQQEISPDKLKLNDLSAVTELDLSYKNLDCLPHYISIFKSLVKINLSRNSFLEIPKELFYLLNLEEISINHNRITVIPDCISMMQSLNKLYASRNKIQFISSNIGKCEKLTSLILRNNELTDIPSSVVNLSQLQSLDISENFITFIPNDIGRLSKLKELYISGNALASVPESIGDLRQLVGLALSSNNLASLPKEICELVTLEKFWIYDNPLQSPPISVATQGLSAIRAYFSSLEGEREIEALQLKVLVLGDGRVGKTSLVKRITKNEFDDEEAETRGIFIDKWIFRKSGKKVTVNFWDFGGQEIMHSTHKFFLTDRSIYLVVIDHENYENLQYWLDLIKNLGGNESKVYIVINKSDVCKKFDIERGRILTRFKFVEEIYKVSCKTNNQISVLKKDLKQAIYSNPMTRSRFPESWFSVKLELEHCTDDFISFEMYKRICFSFGVTNEFNHLVLLKYLHDLGIVLHFDNIGHDNTYVINPKWVTEAVYALINSEDIRENKGRFCKTHLWFILDKSIYPVSSYPWILSLMESFKLCVPLNRVHYLLPSLLPESPVSPPAESGDVLKIKISMDFLFIGIFSMLITSLMAEVDKESLSKHFMAVKSRQFCAEATIRMHVQDSEIDITVSGERKADFLAYLVYTIRDINSSFLQNNIKVLIKISDTDNIFVNYDDVAYFKSIGKDEIFVKELQADIPLEDILQNTNITGGKKMLDKQDGKTVININKFHGNLSTGSRTVNTYHENLNSDIDRIIDALNRSGAEGVSDIVDDLDSAKKTGDTKQIVGLLGTALTKCSEISTIISSSDALSQLCKSLF